MHFVAR